MIGKLFRINLLPKLSTLTLLLILASIGLSQRVTAQELTSVSGVLSVLYGDQPDSAVTLYKLTSADGRTLMLAIPPDVLGSAGGIMAIQGANVTVGFDSDVLSRLTPGTMLAVESLTVEGEAVRNAERQGITGAEHWVNLMCRFKNDADEPFTPAEITGLFANDFPFLDHYWREASYGKVSIPSVTTTPWVSLPHTRDEYVAMSDPHYLDAIFDDCTAAHDATVNYGEAFGINLFFNAALDGYYWGSSCQYRTLDGAEQCWRTTWLPYYGFARFDLFPFTHEMGHAHGLPHSNNSDGDGDPYDNRFDIMSGNPCMIRINLFYGCLQPHTNAWNKDSLGWFDPANVFRLTSPGSYPLTLDNIAKPTSTNFYAAFIPIDATHFYTVEARRNDIPGYENTLLNSGVIIYEVDLNRGEPAWQVNGVTDGTSVAGSGIFLPGETYVNTQHDFAVRVDSMTADGFAVTVIKGEQGAPPDLSLQHAGTDITPGKAVINLEIINLGATTAHSVVVAFDLPEGYVNTLTAIPECVKSPIRFMTTFICELGDLASGASILLPVEWFPWYEGAFQLSAVVVSNETEDVTTNNSVTVTTGSVTPLPDLSVTLELDKRSAVVLNESVNYVVRVRNIGGIAAENFDIALYTPEGFLLTHQGAETYGNGTVPDCTSSEGSISCHIEYLGSTFDASLGEFAYTAITLTGYATVTTYGDKSMLASIPPTGLEISGDNNFAIGNVHVGTPADVTASFNWQGRPTAPSAQYITPVDLKFTPVGGGDTVHILATADANGQINLEGRLLSGEYRVVVKGGRSLSAVSIVTIAEGNNSIHLGTLREGDANEDNVVTITDFSILASSFGTVSGQPNFDGRADFNNDNAVTIIDFSLLASNFGQVGQN